MSTATQQTVRQKYLKISPLTTNHISTNVTYFQQIIINCKNTKNLQVIITQTFIPVQTHFVIALYNETSTFSIPSK